MQRRQFLLLAASISATAAWAGPASKPSRLTAKERRDLFPEGVASGDPDARSVLLWTRRPFPAGTRAQLQLEVAADPDFSRVVVTKSVMVLAAADWTCRVLVGNLKPAQMY